MFVIIMAKSINLTSFDIDTLKSIIFKKMLIVSMNYCIRQFQAKNIYTLERERGMVYEYDIYSIWNFFGKYTML